MNLPPGCTEADIDHTVPEDEPEYELTEADLEEAYLEALGFKELPAIPENQKGESPK